MDNNNESLTLEEWIMEHHDEDDVRTVFLNMDIALKYIHDHGYCIEVFYPSEIEILNNEIDHIQFKKLMELSSDPIIKKNMIQEDIFNSALMQIGLYFYSDGLGLSIASILGNLKPEILKEHFDEYSQVIPNGDIPYYRGVVQRGASVYFSEFASEKRNRDLIELEKQLGEEGDAEEKPLQLNKEPLTNDRVNDTIYRQINGLRDTAFINTLIIPTIVLIVIIIFAFIAWIISGI